jgi:hypothetical protein
MFSFGSGTLWGTPVAGNLPANPTPIKFGTLQSVDLDIGYEIKELYGMNNFPEAIARGKGKITGKAKFGRINSNLFNQLFFAQNTTQPMELGSRDEAGVVNGAGGILTAGITAAGTGYAVGDVINIGGAGTGGKVQVVTVTAGAITAFTIVASGTSYVVASGVATTAATGSGTGFTIDILTVSSGANTITVAHAGAFFQDNGVIYAATGIPLIKVGSSPAVGQYTVASGVYTFNAAEAGVSMLISYFYLAASGVGYDQTIMNQLMGFEPIFTLTFSTTFNAQQLNWILWNCVSSKLTLGSKLDDFLIPEMDFSAFATPAGKVIDIYASE